MINRVEELKAEARANKNKAEGKSAALAAIAKMQEPDRAMAKDDKVVCFFQPAREFKARYATFDFNDTANLDEGNIWPVAFAVKELRAADEARISALVKKAVS